jgi:Eukaryotic aspartyl protease
MAGNTIRVPITNVYGGGDYTAPIRIGSSQVTANVILDTGSSTLAVIPRVYDVSGDSTAQPTSLAQDVIYGTGGWTGPVLTTNIVMGVEGQSASLDTYIAMTVDDERQGFGAADGIMGLAYNVLNSAYNLSAYLKEQGRPAVTYPWPFPVKNTSAAIQQFAAFLQRMPAEDLPPYFTALETAGVEKNIFAFYTLRSVPSFRSQTPDGDQLNQGFFIMGGGPEQTDLYTGDFVNVAVVDDAWYNTDLLGVQVGSGKAIDAKQLPSQFGKTMISNSIVDSGTNSLALSNDVFTAIMSSLDTINPHFTKTIETAARTPVPVDNLRLHQWPEITFILRGDSGQPVSLPVAPDTYWQVDCPKAGQAICVIGTSGMPQSILGLPLMNNYYCVFDRTQNPYGVIRFAPIKASP